MTKEEIKAAIAEGIAGQGTNVDGGGYLPKILNAIVDAIPEGGGNEPYIVQGASVVLRDGAPVVLKVPAQEYARAKEAFLNGRVVFIPEINGIAYIATAYSRDAIEAEDGEPIEGLCLSARSIEIESDGASVALISQ